MLTRRKDLFLLPIVALLCICVRVSTSSPHGENATKVNSPSLRLPLSVQPVMYYLHITTRIHEDVTDFSGNVTIDLSIARPTDEIILHAKYLREFIVTLTDLRGNRQFDNIVHSFSRNNEHLRIYSSAEPLNLHVGDQCRLEIIYTGDIQDKHFGFYKTIYKDNDGKNIPLATTQFEPTSARLAFPCFDEPSFKSRFLISITHGSNYSAISNMPVDGMTIPSFNGEMTTTTFATTPLMPTYLLAFVVSNYNHISEFRNGIEYRVYLPPNSDDNGYEALTNSIKTLNALEQYIGVKYPLPKLDHICLDKTYGSAMENWGLITYNKKSFISNMGERDKLASLKLIIVQNHEMAHQWFGNLVSPKWWTYAWLNEGFATYFAYIATELVYPDLRIPEYFIETEAEITYNWPINRAMTHYVEDEVDIKLAFDAVTYQKAACFIKMFHHAIGHKTFIKGVALFLTKFQYSVADEGDLFGALQEAVNEDGIELFQGSSDAVAEIMHTWTHNQGIPIITIIRHYDEGTITIRQRSSSKHLNESWWIPLNFATASDPNFEKTTADYIMPPVHKVTINLKDYNINISSSDWLIANKQQTGLLHVVYDDNNLQLIANALNDDHTQIHMLNRALLFRDQSAAMDKEFGEIEPLLDVLRYLKYEEELMPWNAAADLIQDLGSQLEGCEAHKLFKTFIQGIIAPSFNKYYSLPKTELGVIDSFARAKIIEVSCQMDLPECLNFTKSLGKQYLFDKVEIDDSLRDISLCQGLKYTSSDEFQKLIHKLSTLDSNSEHYDDIIYSLRCVNSVENLMFFLDILFGESSKIKLMDDFESMQYLMFLYVYNTFSRPYIMQYMLDNYRTMFRRDSTIVTGLLHRVAAYVSDDDGQTEKFMDLMANAREVMADPPKIDETKIGLRVRKRLHFRRKYSDKVYAWLTNNERQRTARSGDTQKRTRFASARIIVAAGFISNLIGLV